MNGGEAEKAHRHLALNSVGSEGSYFRGLRQVARLGRDSLSLHMDLGICAEISKGGNNGNGSHIT